MIGLIADSVHPKLLELLDSKGFKFDYLPDIGQDELIRIIKNYDFLIVRGRTIVDRKVLENAAKLKVIIRYGVGLDNIDINYAKQRGVSVYNTPQAFTEAVAELTIALILGVLRGIGEAHMSLKMGRWEKSSFLGYELHGKTVAILGFGRIGRRVADLLEPFNVNIIAYDIIPIPEEYIKKGVKQARSLKEAVENADIITIHMPLTSETLNLIDYELFKSMKRKPYIINTARGKIINQNDLKKALSEGLIKGAALDVYVSEPLDDEELIKFKNILLTPHIGAQTYEAREKAAYEVVNILERELKR